MTRLAVLGAGHVGPVIARIAAQAGYAVSIAASGDPAQIELTTRFLAPGAQPRWAADAVADADLVVLSIPLHRFAALDPALLAGRLVIDTMNYWPPTDGVQPMFADPELGSSEIVARRLAGATVVKSLNHLGYHQIDEDRRPAGSPQRRALGVAGDDSRAVATVAGVIEGIGFDAVQLPSLHAGWLLEPGGPVFGASLPRAEFELAVASPVSRSREST